MDYELKDNPEIAKLFREWPMGDTELMISLGLFMRVGQLTKILFIKELYDLIVDLPGVIMEFGCWAGQNLILFENMRAIYEPYNPRTIIGFDTFTGYVKDGSGLDQQGNYDMPNEYPKYLRQLIAKHQDGKAIINTVRACQGDAIKVLPKYLRDYPETRIALAYFDMAEHDATKACLEIVKARLVKGGIIMLDEYNNPLYPGETQAFHEVFDGSDYEIMKSKVMPGRTIVRVK